MMHITLALLLRAARHWHCRVSDQTDHPRAPGVAATDYVTISLLYPWHITFKNSSEIAHEECGRPPAMYYNFV